MPHELNLLALENPTLFYDLLFTASAQTLLEIAADPKHLGAEIGIISTLHTWGQNLLLHPHIHCVVPAGGLAPDHRRWVRPRYPFFLPVKVLSRVFRGKFLAGLKRLHRRKKLHCAGPSAALADPQQFAKLIRRLGAQQDSLRFARAIAADLGLSRYDVRATVLGEHGEAMLPVWRSVELIANDPRAANHLADLCTRSAASPLEVRVAVLRTAVRRLLSEERISEAYRLVHRALPDARVLVEPEITVRCLHSTPHATANATLQCIAAALANDRRRVHGQVELKGEVLDLDGVCGIPLTIGKNGWNAEPLDWLRQEEISAVRKSTHSVEEFISGILIDAVRATLPAGGTARV